MCGGVRFSYSEEMQPMLSEAYSGEQIEQFAKSGTIQSVFWQPRPLLPAVVGGKLQLFDWGNRDESLKLPKTGWVRQESLDAGKWKYLKPTEIIIPAFEGVEKKVWFTIEHGIRGLLVHRGDQHRVYMITHQPTAYYLKLTGHDRMPALIDQDEVVPL